MRFTLMSLLIVLTVAGGWLIADAEEKKPQGTVIRVGLFDSRAIAVAFAGSELHDAELKEVRKRYDAAKASGDEKTKAAIEKEMEARQARMHHQGFGTASVQDILDRIEEKLPALAAEAGVDVLVSKWDVAWQRDGAKTVDVTWPLVEVFGASERVRGWVEDLQKKDPISASDIDAHHTEKGVDPKGG